MLIEDVDFLQENSTKNSVVAIVDSAERNKEIHKTPSEYTVDFDDPIRLVYGIEVLDATIPTTMYDIDFNNNRLQYLFFSFNNNAPTTGSVEGDKQRISELLTEADTLNTFRDALASNNNVKLYIVSDVNGHMNYTVPTVISPSETHSILLFARREVTLASAGIMVGVPQSFTGAWITFQFANISYYISTTSSLASVITQKTFIISTNGTIIYYVFVNPEEGSISPLAVTDDPFYCVITKHVFIIENGNYSINDLAAYISNFNDHFEIRSTLTAGGLSFEKQSRFKFISKLNYPFILDMKNSSCSTTIGFESVAQEPFAIHMPGNKYMYFSNISTDEIYYIDAPGVVNIDGPKYIVLRCKEVEDHIYSNYYSSKYSKGLGIFKLISVNNVAFLRFDFVTLIKKPFHPIGKLSRLTFRFELPDGSLYDFKGVNHYMMLSINHFSPVMQKKSGPSVLNPNYEPDYISYMIKYMDTQALDPSSSRRQDKEADRTFDVKDFLQNHNENDYSSSESEEETNTDSESEQSLSDENLS